MPIQWTAVPRSTEPTALLQVEPLVEARGLTPTGIPVPAFANATVGPCRVVASR